MSKEILKLAKAFVKSNKRYPTLPEMESLGISRASIRHQYSNMMGFYDALYKECKEYFFDVNKEVIPKINTSKYKSFVITTALTGNAAHVKALESIDTYCKKFNSLPIVLISKGNNNFG